MSSEAGDGQGGSHSFGHMDSIYHNVFCSHPRHLGDKHWITTHSLVDHRCKIRQLIASLRQKSVVPTLGSLGAHYQVIRHDATVRKCRFQLLLQLVDDVGLSKTAPENIDERVRSCAAASESASESESSMTREHDGCNTHSTHALFCELRVCKRSTEVSIITIENST